MAASSLAIAQAPHAALRTAIDAEGSARGEARWTLHATAGDRVAIVAGAKETQ